MKATEVLYYIIHFNEARSIIQWYSTVFASS